MTDQNNAVKNVLVLIPARYASSRFPGKPLAKINGQSMISLVYKNCQHVSNVQGDIKLSVCVVTDSDEIEQHLKSEKIEYVRVNDDVISGTERIALAYERFFSKGSTVDLVINVQGDEPLVNTDDLLNLARGHLASKFHIMTLVKKQSDPKSFIEPDIVKAVYSESTGQCFYFSRAAVPYQRDPDKENESHWFQHIGVYSYLPKALMDFKSLKPSKLELTEKLEQLRALENDMLLGAVLTDKEYIGVDSPKDLNRLKEYI